MCLDMMDYVRQECQRSPGRPFPVSANFREAEDQAMEAAGKSEDVTSAEVALSPSTIAELFQEEKGLVQEADGPDRRLAAYNRQIHFSGDFIQMQEAMVNADRCHLQAQGRLVAILDDEEDSVKVRGLSDAGKAAYLRDLGRSQSGSTAETSSYSANKHCVNELNAVNPKMDCNMQSCRESRSDDQRNVVSASPRHGTNVEVSHGDEGNSDICSTCSVLSNDSGLWTKSLHVEALLAPIRRSTRECKRYLRSHSLDGTWVCNRSASHAPEGIARWARFLRIERDNVVLGTGHDAALVVDGGCILLEKGRLARVGNKLMRFGRNSTLVYELQPEGEDA
eukprot:TRINITY_DN41824_c0_g1_i2.p1 TRINITY_DN41824_c0_g1~~TRINITY_DN41824_c0_g1_i2.p1  ORF type:complete len:337 (+),score=35.31 TRINITY_DN41824_c0_g1_i2:158-1168(+)